MIEIKIEGNYLDSFIYSGSFFLLNSEMQLTSFSWKDIINCIEEPDKKNKEYIYQYFSGKNYNSSIINTLKSEYIISEEKINKMKCNFCTLDFDYWITDMDIYKNTLFVSSHEGIDSIATNRQEFKKEEPKFEFISTEKNRIIHQKVFDITAGNYSRLIAACGYEGALQLNLRGMEGKTYELATEEYQFSTKFWTACDWNTDVGIAVIKHKLEQAFFKFNKIEKDEQICFNKREILFKKLNKEEKIQAIQEKKPQYLDTKNNIINSWIEEDRVFVLTNELKFHELNLKDENLTDKIVEDTYQSQFDIENILLKLNNNPILETQKTNFGILVETLDELFIIPDKQVSNQINKSFNQVTNWRTFPKSKNYRNHLHVIQDDYVSIIGVDLSKQA